MIKKKIHIYEYKLIFLELILNHLCTKQVFRIQFNISYLNDKKKKDSSDSTTKKISYLFSRLLRLVFFSFFFLDTCSSTLKGVEKYQSMFWTGFFENHLYIVQLLITQKCRPFSI